METDAIAAVSTGPPPGAPPEPMQLDGGIAATELLGAPPPAPVPQGADAAGGDSTTSASSPMEVDAQDPPAQAPSAPTLNSKNAQDPLSHTPASLDVFADTDASANISFSRHFGDDGDAVMEGETNSTPSRAFTSQLRPAEDRSKSKGNAAGRPPRTPSSTRTTRPPPKAPAKPPRTTAKGREAARNNGPPGTAMRPRSKQAPVWSQQGAAELRASLGGARTRSAAAHQTDDGAQNQGEEPALAEFYMCAKKPAHMRLDGDQRAMTKLEEKTLFMWLNHQVHLAQPPLFLKETHTGMEQDAFADFHGDHLGFRLYGILPAGCSLSDENAKYHFCFTALQASSKAPATRLALERMLAAARVIKCESKSRIVVLRFVRPEVRESWRGLTFPFGNGTVTLEATDSLTTDLPKIGLDASAMKLLYHVYVRGPDGYRHGEMRKIIASAAEVPVFAIEWVESVGLTDFSSPMWKCTFNRITCPKALEHVRRLQVQFGDKTAVFGVHHPRASRRAPCVKCLSVRHVSNECKNAYAAAGLERHTATVEVVPPALPPKLTAAISPKKLATQLEGLREFAAPEVGIRLRSEDTERLAKIEQKAKRRADRAAREAAAEAREINATKAQATAELARSQVRLSKAAFRAMTKQLKTLQVRAQRVHEGYSGPVESPSGTPSRSPSPVRSDDDAAHAVLDAACRVTRMEHNEEIESACESATASDNAPGVEFRVESATASANEPETEPESESETEAATEPATESATTRANATTTETAIVATPAQETGLAIELSIEAVFTEKTEPVTAVATASAPVNTTKDAKVNASAHDPGAARDVQPIESDRVVELIDEGDVRAGLKTTGKRSNPPTPTSSDDERAMYSKAHRTKHPFDSDESPIPVADSLSELIAAATIRNAERKHALAKVGPPAAAATEARTMKQLPLSTFYVPQTLAAAQEQLEKETAARMARPISRWLSNFPSPALDALLEDLRAPLAIATWIQALHARVVNAPANGGCLFYALHLCRTRWKISGNSITTRSKTGFTKHTHEANSYKRFVCRNLLQYLEPMISDGTVTIADFNNRFFKEADRPPNRPAALTAIRTFIGDIEIANVGKGLDPTQWGSDAELFATVWYIREPLFIITEDATKRTSVRIIWMERAYPDGPERLAQLFPDADEAYEMIRTFLQHRFLPTILLHVMLSGQGHFNSLRFEESMYTDWTADDESGEAMRDRLNHALGKLGWYVAPNQPVDIPTTIIMDLLESGSEYEPSQPELLDSTATPMSLDAPLSPPAHYALLSAINPRGRRRGILAHLWDQAERQNLAAYQMWDAAQQHDDVRTEPDTLHSGCRYWSAQTSQLVSLLRALPYPEVAMSLLPADIIQRLGNELTNLAADGSVPPFVRAEDPVEASRQWARLVALVVVASDDDLIELVSVDWLRQHPNETIAALHEVRRYDWTAISKLARPASPTLPVHPPALGSQEAGVPVSVASTLPHTSTVVKTPDHRVVGTRPIGQNATPSRSPERPNGNAQGLRLISQNVQGLAKNWESVLAWFDGFRKTNGGQSFDVVILQETRATEQWAGKLEDLYARAWGYDPRRLHAPLSYWPATPKPAAGVAVLLAPNSALSAVSPWNPDLWSSHFVAIQGLFDGAPITVVCIYAPTKTSSREQLFSTLSAIDPPTGTLLVGGDFNCVMDAELDRSRRTRRSHTSGALGDLLDSWSLMDSVSDDMLAANTPTDVAAFHAEYHTYMYQLRDDAIATARLDRWYVSLVTYGQVGTVATAPPVARSDHDSVSLELHTSVPVPPGRGKQTPRLRYPLPECAVDAILMCGHDALITRGVPLAQLDALAAAVGWDELKKSIRRESLIIRRHCLAKATARYRARVRRLHHALRDAKAALHLRLAPATSTIEHITIGMSALALDPASRYRSIRRSLISLQAAGTARTALQRHARHAGRPHESSNALFRRISVQYCRRRTRSLPVEPGSSLGPADRVARDWRPIIQRPPLDPVPQDTLFAQLPPKTVTVDLSAVDDPITVSEVAAAIKACPRGKACGPDGLSNDWYRDHAADLSIVLAPLFTKWYAEGVLPPSFVAATVICIPKKSQPQTGLDFRPIALLNTDYKLYSRVLLGRVRVQVPRLVANTQYGFVPGRQVHDAIDVWTALQANAASGDGPPGALAVFLDFAKAYDSLDRRFLSLALQRHGFPSALVTAVNVMHLGTTAAFIADGHTSATEEVWTGIRQGCPLAPTLFILAVDVLYELIALDPTIPGVLIDGDVRVSLVGFADDTTAYLNSPAEVPALRRNLDLFAEASGLCVNESKSVAICLSATGSTAAHAAIGFPLATLTQIVRYLGGQISTAPMRGQVWIIALQQIRARLVLAEIKTTDLLQRVQICQSVVLPKMLFIARHAWPSAPIVKRLQQFVRNYAWHGTVADTAKTRRAWMSPEVASLQRADGGLQLPEVREALLTMSALTVQRWMSATDPVAASTGRVLARSRAATAHAHVAPGRGLCPALRLGPTIASTGRAVLRGATSTARDADEITMLLPLLADAGRAPLSSGIWIDGGYQRDYSAQQPALTEIERYQQARFGRLNIPSLLATPVLGQNLLLHHTGRPIDASDFPGLRCAGARLGDLLEIDWVQAHVLRFRLTGATYPYAPVESFRTLCDTVVMCYPALLRPHDPPCYLSERGETSDVWSLRGSPDGTELIREVGPHEQRNLGVVTTLRHAETVARQETRRRRLQFAPHPTLCSVLPLWGQADRFSRKTLRTLVASANAARAQADIDRREDAAQALSATFGAALATVEWGAIHGLAHSSSRQRLLFYKTKGLRLSGWDALHERRGCPHCASAGSDGGTTLHIMWTCPSAQHLWRTVRLWWESLGLWTAGASDDHDFLTAVFSLRLPRTPTKVWDMVSLSQRSPAHRDAPDGPFPALQAAWQQIVLETMVVILSWRNGRSDPERDWVPALASVIHDASCQRVLDTLAHRLAHGRGTSVSHAPLVRELRQLFADPKPPRLPPAPAAEAVHVLFFDGGSRGNPGPGGSGACVVRVGARSGAAELVWSASMSLAHPTTTNNQAEYGGLLAGLRAARQHSWTALEVVGDSALILRQLRDYRPPKNARLLRLYSEARRLGDRLDIRKWTHHVRANNKMADSLANLAMDTVTSSQVTHPTARPGHADLHAHLGTDLRPWLADFVHRHVDFSMC